MSRVGECAGGGGCGARRGKAAHAGAGAVAGFLGCLLLVWAMGGCGRGCGGGGGEGVRDRVEEVAAQFNLSMSKLQALASLLSSPELEGGPFGFDAETGFSRGCALFVYRAAEGASSPPTPPGRANHACRRRCVESHL
ncbi:hypothetical protein OsI_33221 [Oryza sativa Indica Group]|uniref:Uncharacterized protein n=1 Tax=Oryza sativa subsp. indica TaxID=39946 RepID=B8BGF7_ORYSI|nr:hypothetical protein OsI_33221 [Oryza sativa Indica Group]